MEILDTCPSCGEEELRPIKIGNNKDGWSLTGDFECDSCVKHLFHKITQMNLQ